MTTSAFKSALTISAMVWLTGCGGAAPAPKPVETPGTSGTVTPGTAEKPPENARPVVDAPSATVSKPVKIEENSAAGAVTRTLQALEGGNLAEAYDFLPPSYQSDIDGLVHEFADKMDGEVWSRLINTSRKGIALLRGRKDDILALDLFRDQPQVEQYRAQWDPSLLLLESVIKDDFADLAKLKKVTARSLLPGKASSAMPHLQGFAVALGANLARQFAGVTVTPVRKDGTDEVVAIRGPNEEQPTEVTYVTHDGCWLPKSLVEHWSEGISADRAWLQKLPERIKAVKPRLLDALNEADEILDQLAAAGNREQFEQAAGPAILALATAWPNLQLLARQAATGQVESPKVTVVINRELTERELSRLVADVLKPLREGGCDYTLLSNDGRTVCRLSRINDVGTLRGTLATHFTISPDDVAFDQETSKITIELAP
jgi:hypothetical protein